MSRAVSTTPESIEEPNHVTFLLPSKTSSSSSSRTSSDVSVTSTNFALKQPRYHALYQPSWREQLAVELDNSAIGSIWKLVDAFLNILLCLIYIAHTAYMRDSLPTFNVCFEVVVAILLLMEYIPKFYIYEFESWKSIFTKVSPILTALTVFPVFATAMDPVFKETRYIVFFYPFRFIRCYLSVHACLVRSEKSVLKLGQVTSKTLIFLQSILFLILTGSSLLHGVEYAYMEEDVTFLDAVFFTTIMLGTVGYLSDIVPDNAFPRILLLVIFTTGLVFIPQPHVIIITPTIELPSLKHFLKEFYSLAHGSATVNTKVVILNPLDPTDRVKTFLSDPVFAHRVQYVRGSSLDARNLEKVDAKNASAYFILAKKYTQQSEVIDAENVLKAIALSKFDEGPKLYIQCILPENKIHFESLNPDQIICIDELKLAILAHSCLTPGFSTLLYGLTTSFTFESAHELRRGTRKRRSSIGLDCEDIEDYITGFSQSIYTTTLSDHFSGHNFLSVVERLYDDLGVVLFALGIPKKYSFSTSSASWMFDYKDDYDVNDPKNYSILINPDDYILNGDEIGFVIALDGSLADDIATYEWHNGQKHKIISVPSEQQPLLTNDTLKNVGGGSYFDKKKNHQPAPSDTPHYEYPHRPDSFTLRRQRAFSTPLVLAPDHEMLHDYSHNITLSSHSHDVENMNSIIEKITDHILLCDYSQTTFPRNLDCFVSPLRKPHLEKITPIVILSPTRPSQNQWKILSQFEKVYFVEGNPMMREGLDCGRVRFAKQAVVLADSSRLLRNGEKTEDASAMLVFLNIKAMCKQNIDVFVEFVHMDNMKFMSEDASAIDKSMQAHHSPAFMAGTCFSLSMLDSIICQSFYQPHIVTIIEQMLFGAPPLHLLSGPTCPAPSHSHFYQIPVKSFIGCQYGELFRSMVQKKVIPLGLYRTKKVKTVNGNEKELKYVYTCPKSKVLLRNDDKVFVLSKKVPTGF
ncbi:calcium-activated BK potassium channel alpha subunit-domain-containing protein [Gigaspora rosea]|uniref:Calcium-activated BK potassium channel alpha subunit-domain-containing protein n=1 Tax=Gigaspora rosea TaxID=44941 RepID=A0A397W8Y4_9GLOM|nr:calcium-activated BK potassium channel alpha subunit-domain-containing protein [Gigaspora rosea]